MRRMSVIKCILVTILGQLLVRMTNSDWESQVLLLPLIWIWTCDPMSMGQALYHYSYWFISSNIILIQILKSRFLMFCTIYKTRQCQIMVLSHETTTTVGWVTMKHESSSSANCRTQRKMFSDRTTIHAIV